MQAEQLIELIKLLSGGGNAAQPEAAHIGRKCIIRTYASGVHFGTLKARVGREVELTSARRLWKWHAAQGISLSDVSVHGIVENKSLICEVVPEQSILDALEVIPCSQIAFESIERAAVAST